MQGTSRKKLADLCHNIGLLHYVLNEFGETKRMVENAINIISDVDDLHSLLEEWQEYLNVIEEKNQAK